MTSFVWRPGPEICMSPGNALEYLEEALLENFDPSGLGESYFDIFNWDALLVESRRQAVSGVTHNAFDSAIRQKERDHPHRRCGCLLETLPSLIVQKDSPSLTAH
jgi:hypothetical protein